MSNEAQVEKIRGKHLALQNDRQEAMARPGKSEKAVVIAQATLDYYKGIERLLEDALELASMNHPPMIEINAAAIGEAMTAAAVDAIAQVVGIRVPVQPPAEELLSPDMTVGEAVSAFSRAAEESVREWPGSWVPVDEAARREGIEIGPVMSAVYAGKIVKRGRGKTLELKIKSFEAWVRGYKERAGK
ncbi:MAG: hypothetical protein KF821_09090 [Anaerolineales bacterium]|nr:hypothetical protein [Anaerolineales bacterium]